MTEIRWYLVDQVSQVAFGVESDVNDEAEGSAWERVIPKRKAVSR